MRERSLVPVRRRGVRGTFVRYSIGWGEACGRVFALTFGAPGD